MRAQRAMLRAPGSYADGLGQPFRPVRRRSRRPFERARRMRRKLARSHPSRASIPAQRSGLAAQPPVVREGASHAMQALPSLTLRDLPRSLMKYAGWMHFDAALRALRQPGGEQPRRLRLQGFA